MLKKVVKYDFSVMGKHLVPLYLAMILLSFVEKLGTILVDSFPIFGTFFGMLTFIYVIVLIGGFIYTFFLAVQSFYNAFMKDEGYLINTLPVTKETLVLSKVIVSSIYIVLTVVVIILSVCLAIMNMELIENIGKFITNLIENGIGADSTIILILTALILLGSYIQQLLFFYFSLALGQTRSSHKLIYSFLFGFVIYTITQIVSTVSLLFMGLFISEFRSVMLQEATLLSNGIVVSLLVYSLVMIMITCIVYFFGTTITLKKYLNLD